MNGLTISKIGILVEGIGLLLDILHHLKIGIETPEGLLTVQHTIIFLGFLITAIGVFLTSRGSK